ncbi:hypothetical protein EJB05_17533, partial [Eragrostis curvula]
MAEMVFSAVVEETLKQALSGLIGSNGQEDVVADVERLEMVQIKLEAALNASRRWRIRDAPLLRWRRKLKRAAEECGGELRERRRRVAAEDDDDDKAREKDSFPRRLARAAAAFFGGGDGCVRDAAAAVKRFEWYADGAGEFLRFVELGGGSPRRHTPRVDPLIGRLLAGEELRYRFVNRRGQYHQFCVRPVRLDGRGVEAKLIFVYEDDEALEKNLCLGAILRLSESTDLVGTLVKCLELRPVLLVTTPHFRPAAESARRELVALPRQDFSWEPSYLDSGDNGHWNAMHSSLSQWFRPNPLCCNAETTPTASDLEPVIGVFLQRHIPLAEYNAHPAVATVADGTTCLKKNAPHLRLGLHFSPHGSSDMAPAAESAAVELVDGEELQTAGGGVHRNISSLEELDEFALPKAIDCLLHRRRPEAAAYQLFWKAKHGTAFLEVEKITGMVKAPPRGVGGSRRAAIQWRRDPKLGMMWTQSVVDFFNLWVACAPRRLQGSTAEWVQKANDMQQRRCPLN